MSISPSLAKASGVVRDYDGSRPCIPPSVLAVVAAKVLLRARVVRDERQEARGAR
jgi:hypothetical protein